MSRHENDRAGTPPVAGRCPNVTALGRSTLDNANARRNRKANYQGESVKRSTATDPLTARLISCPPACQMPRFFVLVRPILAFMVDHGEGSTIPR